MFWEDPLIPEYKQILNETVPEGYEMVYYSELSEEERSAYLLSLIHI